MTQNAVRSTQNDKIGFVFSIPINRGVRRERRGSKTPSYLHQYEFLHIKNLCVLGVLGGKTTELAPFDCAQDKLVFSNHAFSQKACPERSRRV